MSDGRIKAAPPVPAAIPTGEGGLSLEDALARTAEGETVVEPVPETPEPRVADRMVSGPRPKFGFEAGSFGQEQTLVLSRSELEARGKSVGEGPAPGIDADQEKGWTPFQPPVADRETPVGPLLESTPPTSDDIPVDTDEDLREFDEAVTRPRLPVPLDSERRSGGETGEVPEVDVADLVSVESIPKPQSPPPPLKTTLRSSPSVPPVSGASLMSGVAPPVVSPPIPLSPPVATAPVYAVAAPAVAAPMPAAPEVRREPAPAVPSVPSQAVPSVPNMPAAPQAPPSVRRLQLPFGLLPALAPPPMSEAAVNRKKTRPWWEDLFNDDFIRTMAKITDLDVVRETNFIEESLGCEAGAAILDLACGTGRHGVELAGRGYQVVGFDLSLAMLARASDEALERHQKVNFIQGDMREMTFEEVFDGVFSWNTSFGYFEDEKNAAVVAKVHRALKKGGQFLLDVVNRDSVIRQAPSLAWFEGDGCICMDEMQVDFITSRMKVKRTLMMDDGRTKEIEYSIRIYSLHELGKMLHDNGFRVAEVSGGTGTPGVFFGCEAPRTLILAEKR